MPRRIAFMRPVCWPASTRRCSRFTKPSPFSLFQPAIDPVRAVHGLHLGDSLLQRLEAEPARRRHESKRPGPEVEIEEPGAQRALEEVVLLLRRPRDDLNLSLVQAHRPVEPDGAQAIAEAMDGATLCYLSDIPGVLDGAGSVIREIDPGTIESLISSGVARDGMAAKLRSCAVAVTSGVGAVMIGRYLKRGDLERLIHGNGGSTIRPMQGTG